MNVLFLDFETYYDADYSLRQITVPEYVMDPRFETILCCVQLNNEPIEVLDGTQVASYFSRLDPATTTTVAFNALFDNFILAHRYNFVPVRMFDAMGMARALRGHMLKRHSLEAVSRDLGLGEKGHEVHQMKGVHRADMDPDQFSRYAAYCKQDVLLCRRIFLALRKEFPIQEQALADLVLRCAVQPQFQGDTELLRNRLAEIEQEKAELIRQCGGPRKEDLHSAPRFQKLLENLGITVATKISPTGRTVPQFARTDPFMSELLENDNPRVQALAAARLGHKSTIEQTRTTKLLKVAEAMPGFAMPAPLRYGGAHTHRLSGDWGMNLQNLPRSGGPSKLRQALAAPAGHTVITCDLGQIEARLVAWQCGCEQLLTEFRDMLDPYSLLASIIFGRPINRKLKGDKVEGFIGKTGILGLGYGCGAEKFYTMVTTGARLQGIDLTGKFDEAKALDAVRAYRGTYREIPDTWKRLDGTGIRYLMGRIPAHNFSREAAFGACKIGEGYVEAPGGLRMRYHELGEDEHGQVFFTYGGERHKLYGGKLLENITQFLARVVVMDAAVRLANLGYRFALQVHDELVFVVPNERLDEAKKTIHAEMTRTPSWAPDLPLTADIDSGPNYGESK